MRTPGWSSPVQTARRSTPSGSPTGSGSTFAGAGLPAIRLHDLRHSYATAALAAGIPAKVVSERLGHATIAITMDTYSHVLPGLDERAAATVARLILDGNESEPGESIDKPLTTGRVVPSTLDSAEGGEARNARSDGQRRRTGIEPA
jgi:hypothetical protein